MSESDSSPIRVFVAVLISEGVRRTIASVQEEFKKAAPKLKWVQPENFHVTIKFLGNVDSRVVPDIVGALNDVLRDVEPFEVTSGGAGAFPSAGRPKTVWVGVTSGHEKLSNVAGLVETALERFGFSKEDKPFKSHITIGRARDDRDGFALAPILKADRKEEYGSFNVESVAVMKSELRREGPVYSVIAEVKLGGGDTKING